MEIKESDWKVFRKLHANALERYCERVLKEVSRTIEKRDTTNHERYLKLWGLLRRRDKTIAGAFNGARRSRAFFQLADLVNEKLITEAELNEFSTETREAVALILSR